MDHHKELYGFPTSVNLKYFASNFQEKQREAKQKEKELANAAIKKELLKIKEDPWKIFSGNRNVISTAENKSIEEEFIDNYYVDLLNLDYLLTAKGIRSHYFKLFRLLFHSSTPVENTSEMSLACDESGILNNCTQLLKTSARFVKNKIENFGVRCLSFVRRIVYVNYCWKLSSHVQKLVVPLKDTSLLREMNKSELCNVYFLKRRSQYDLIFVMLSLFWNDLPIPIIFLNSCMKSWKFSILERILFTMIDWKNVSSENIGKDYEKLQLHFEQILKSQRDVLFCLGDSHEDEFDVICQVVKSIVEKYTIPDVLLTTINFSFEVISDNAIENALLFNQKSAFKDTLFNHNFNYNLGLVRAKFGTPISLKEITNSYGNNVVEKMTICLNWELSESQILMSTDLVSFILLYKFRDGVKLNDLIKEVDSFKNELNYRGKRIGFAGNARAIVKHAITMLNDKIAMVPVNNEFIVKPILHLPNVLGLSRLSQNVLNYFVLDAAMMTCLAILFRSHLENTFKCGGDLIFNHSELIEKIELLCEILQFEFNFNNPMLPLSSEISNVMFKYIEQEYFVKNEKLMTDEEQWGHRLAKHLESDDEDDYDYRSNRGDTYTVQFDNNGDLYSKITVFKKSLQPVLESYAVTIGELKSLIDKCVIHSELMKRVFMKLKHSFENNFLEFPESVSMKFVCKSIRLMEKWKVLKSYTIGEIKVWFLSNEYNNEKSLCDIECKVRNFL